jgi:hypothetical protein
MDKWLEETKEENLSLDELIYKIEDFDFPMELFRLLEGENSEEKAKILYNKWHTA